MSSKTRRSFATLNTQVRAACGPIHEPNDLPLAARGIAENATAGEVSKSMADLYRRFLIDPTPERYQAALAALAMPAARPVPSLLALEQALVEQRFETVRTLVRQWTRYFALSPRFHHVAALAARHLGDLEDAETERFAADACLEGILKSGDGSQSQPYLITHRCDAQEVLSKLRFQRKRQRCLEMEGSACDVFEVQTAKSTKEIWFTLANSTGAPKPAIKSRQKRGKKVTA
jgi:hypothetical protein